MKFANFKLLFIQFPNESSFIGVVLSAVFCGIFGIVYKISFLLLGGF